MNVNRKISWRGAFGVLAAGTFVLAGAGAASAQTVHYVDGGFAGSDPGDPVVFEFPGGSTENATYGTDAFSQIQPAVDASDPDGTVHVAPGVYLEQVTVSTSGLSLYGPQRDVPGDDTDRVYTDEAAKEENEAVIRPPDLIPYLDPDEAVVYITSSATGAELNGFTIEGSNPDPDFEPGGDPDAEPLATTGGVDVYAALGILAVADGATISHNILRDFGDDASASGAGFPVAAGMELADFTGGLESTAENNRIENVNQEGTGALVGIIGRGNHYPTLTGNHIEGVRVGIQLQGYTADAPSEEDTLVSGNFIRAAAIGIYHNIQSAGTLIVLSGNTIESYIPGHTEFEFDGIRYETIGSGVAVEATGNSINPRYTELGFTADAINSVGLRVTGNATQTTSVLLGGNTVTDAGTAVRLDAHDSSLSTVADTTITNSVNGVRASSGSALLDGGTADTSAAGNGLFVTGSAIVTLAGSPSFSASAGIGPGGTLNLDEASLHVGGSLSRDSGGTFDAGTGAVVLTGPEDAAISGGFSGAHSFATLRLEKDATDPLPAVTADGDVWADLLVLGTGLLDNTGGNTVLLTGRVPDFADGSATASGVRALNGGAPVYSDDPADFAASHVIGPLARSIGEDEATAGESYYLFPVSDVQAFPVGDVKDLFLFRFDLSPAQTASGEDATGTMTVSATGGAPHPETGAEDTVLNVYWTIETEGFTAENGAGAVVLHSRGHRFHFSDEGKPPGFDDAAEDGYLAQYFDTAASLWTTNETPEDGVLWAIESDPDFSFAQLGASPEVNNFLMPAGNGSPLALDFAVFAISEETAVVDWDLLVVH